MNLKRLHEYTGKVQTVQHFVYAVLESADSTALWQCRIAKVQTVQHFGNATLRKPKKHIVKTKKPKRRKVEKQKKNAL